jgi:DNA repair exonuclease SbcCD ATPase subunit
VSAPSLRVTSVSFRNFKGLDDGKYDIGIVTTISGENEAGKTTLMTALTAALGGGSIAKYKRKKAEGDPEIDLELNGGEYVVQRRVTGTKVQQRVNDAATGKPSAAYEDVRRPQQYIDDRYDARLSSPIAFVNASPADRIDILLQILGADIDAARAVMDAVGDDLWPVVAKIVQAGGHPVKVIDAARQAIFDERTAINRSERQSSDSAERLKRTIPPDLPEAIPAELGDLEKRRDELATATTQARARAESEYRTVVAEATGVRDKLAADVTGSIKSEAAKLRQLEAKHISDAEAEAERKIAAIRAELNESARVTKAKIQEQIDALRTVGDTQLEVADADLEKARAAAESKRSELLKQVAADQPELDKLTSQIATLRQKSEEITRVRTVREQIETFEREAKEHEGRAERLTAGLASVDALKSKLLASLPIPGVEIEGKTLKVNGLEFDEEMNKGQQLAFAAKVAAIRAEKHPIRLILMDNAESVDERRRQALLVDLERMGMQIVVAVVEAHDLRIETGAKREPVAATA